jgi:hypothetical protein
VVARMESTPIDQSRLPSGFVTELFVAPIYFSEPYLEMV